MGDRARLDDAGRRTLALYQQERWRVRLHATVRWKTCPFAAVSSVVPAAGRVLEIGCGHGLLSVYLALESGDREVWGTDVDGAKIRCAGRIARRSGANVRFVPAAPRELPQGPWDAIAVVDVLYLMSPPDQKQLLRRAAALLGSDGVLIVKEMAPQPAWKFTLMRLQEVAAVRLLRITAGDTLSFVPPAVASSWLASAGLAVESRPVDAGYPHPHHLLVGRRLPSG